MNREEFARLPLAVALGVLYDLSPGQLEETPMPELPKPASSPKFDTRIRRRGGFMWASECDVEGLRFWLNRASQPSTDEKYRESSEKQAKALRFFLAWREQNPSSVWVGERNRTQMAAAPPASRPRVYEWEPREEQSPQPQATVGYEADEFDSVPF